MEVAREEVEHEEELKLFVNEGMPCATMEHEGLRVSDRKDQPENNLAKYLAKLERFEAALSPVKAALPQSVRGTSLEQRRLRHTVSSKLKAGNISTFNECERHPEKHLAVL